jgi:hypothetical protein
MWMLKNFQRRSRSLFAGGKKGEVDARGRWNMRDIRLVTEKMQGRRERCKKRVMVKTRTYLLVMSCLPHCLLCYQYPKTCLIKVVKFKKINSNFYEEFFFLFSIPNSGPHGVPIY